MDASSQFRIKSIDLHEPVLPFAMPLVAGQNGHLSCLGTAFPIAPGLAITAAHVAADWIQDDRGREELVPRASVTALQWWRGQLYPWSVEAVTAQWSADVAFLVFRRPQWWGTGEGQVTPPVNLLNMNPPAIGDEVQVFGFPGSSIEDGVLYISPATCKARVRDVSLRHGIRIRPASYVELEGEILGGMSGGPCFDSDGKVIGMASKGWDFLEDVPNDVPISYMALIWPAMNSPVDLYKTGSTPIWEILNVERLRPVGHRRVQVTRQGGIRFGNVDPDTLQALPLHDSDRLLRGQLAFAVENSELAFAEIRQTIADAMEQRQRLDANVLHRALRHFFWELDSALTLAVRIAAVSLGVGLPDPFDWDSFIAELNKRGTDVVTMDAFEALRFAWQSTELFEIRSYSKRARNDALLVQAVEGTHDGALVHCALDPCRAGGGQHGLPDDLQGFLAATQRFVQKLLRLAH